MTDEERAAIAAICVAHADRAPHVLATLRRPEWDSLELVHAREAFVKTYSKAIAAIVRELVADDVAELVAVVKLCGRAMRDHAWDLLSLLINAPRLEVALAAIEVGSERGMNCEGVLLAVIEHAGDSRRTAAAIRALTVLDHEAVLRPAIARWDEADVELCEAIVIACEWFGGADETLAVAAKHPAPRVRARAALAVRSPGVVAAEVPALEAVLQRERDPATLLVYADVLQREGDPRGELIALGEIDQERKLALAMQWIGARKLGHFAWNPRRIRDGFLDEYRGRADAFYVRELLRSPAGRYLCGATLDTSQRSVMEAFAAQQRPWVRRLCLVGRTRMDLSKIPAVLAVVPNLEELDDYVRRDPTHPTARMAAGAPSLGERDNSYLAIAGYRRLRYQFLDEVAWQQEWLSEAARATWGDAFAIEIGETRALPGMRRALSELDDDGFTLPSDDAPVEVARFELDLY